MKKIYTLLSLMIISLASSAQCSELFFSEYSEGSSNNKYMEIYNPTNAAVDLSAYSIHQIGNGGSYTNDFQLYGTLASNAVFVFSTDQADASILAVADTALSYPSVAHFNGDDCMLLLNGTDTIDQLGERRVRPSGGWAVGSGSTKDYTLVRKYTIEGPDTAWASTSIAGWDILPKDDWSNVGIHSSTCHPPAATEPSTAAADPTADAVDVISIYSQSYTDPAGIDYFPNWGQSTQYSVFEIGTDSMIKYAALNYQGIDFNASEIDASAMEYLHLDIWTADVDNFMVFPISRSGENSVTKSLTKGSWASLDIPLSDYTSQGLSMSDIFQLKLEDPANSSGTVFIDNIYFWKMPTLVYTVADIADVIMLDADLAATNEDALYELTGVVYGVDLDGNAGISFTIIDETAGINIFNYNDVDDYVVTEGDEITVKGKIDFYNGLLELFADSIVVNSSGNTLKSATQVEAPSEATESDFIVLRKVWITNDTTTMWPNNGNVELTNDDMDTFQIRIDKDIPGVVGMPVEFDTMTITGLGGQYDGSAPYNEGYQIFPRGLSDIAEYVDRSSVRESVIETRVYPNPTSNNLTVIGTQKWDTYQVFNILGGIVLEGSLSNNNLTVSDLNTGTYIVKLYAGENTGVARFVVNR
ncbi:MAG: hypothetical protein ACI80H_001045 [Pseudoalteromonas distincta]|jgi:hypothetical protein